MIRLFQAGSLRDNEIHLHETTSYKLESNGLPVYDASL